MQALRNVPTTNKWTVNSYLGAKKIAIPMDSRLTFESVMIQMDKLESQGHTNLTLTNGGNIFLQ